MSKYSYHKLTGSLVGLSIYFKIAWYVVVKQSHYTRFGRFVRKLNVFNNKTRQADIRHLRSTCKTGNQPIVDVAEHVTMHQTLKTELPMIQPYGRKNLTQKKLSGIICMSEKVGIQSRYEYGKQHTYLVLFRCYQSRHIVYAWCACVASMRGTWKLWVLLPVLRHSLLSKILRQGLLKAEKLPPDVNIKPRFHSKSSVSFKLSKMYVNNANIFSDDTYECWNSDSLCHIDNK